MESERGKGAHALGGWGELLGEAISHPRASHVFMSSVLV